MKKNLILTLGAALIFSFNSFADKADMFTYNETEVSVNMEQLDELETYVNNHEGVTYEEVKAENAELVANVSETPMLIGRTQKKPPLGIPSFLWGCIFGVAGLAVVYFITDNKKETKKALWGCVTSTGVVLLVYILAFVVFASSATSAASSI